MAYYAVPAAQPVGMYAPPGETIITQTRIARPWASGTCDPCGGPDGCSTCCYVMWCAPCAAGDIAAAADKSYCCSCFVIPVLLPCLAPGHFATDRQALVNKYGITDELGCLGACLCFYVGCGGCLLCQSIAFLKANGYYGGGGGGVTYVQETAVVVQPAPQMMYMAPPPTAAAVVYAQ